MTQHINKGTRYYVPAAGDVVGDQLIWGDDILACVKGCEGINPEAVPDMMTALRRLHDMGFEDGSQPLRNGLTSADVRGVIAKATKASAETLRRQAAFERNDYSPE